MRSIRKADRAQLHLRVAFFIEAIYTFCRGDKEVSHAFLFSATIQPGHYSPILIFFFSQLGYTGLSCNIQVLSVSKVILPALQIEQITGGTLVKQNANTIVSFYKYLLALLVFFLPCLCILLAPC